MKIDPTTIYGPNNPAATPKPASETLPVGNASGAAKPSGKTSGPSNPADGGPSGTGTDRVQLSNLLENLRHEGISGESDLTPERAAYLDKLGAQVASGDYKVDADALSARIIDDTIKGIG